MAVFRFGSRRGPPREEQVAPESDGAPEASNGASPPEVPERVARLRDLDEEIRRRDGELRSSKEAERANPANIAPRDASARTKSADSGSAVRDRMAATVEDARKDTLKLAGRVEALESSVRETQQRNWEALQEHQELVNERLGGLEKRVEDARAAATEAEAEAAPRLEKLAARLDALESLTERLEAVDEQLGAAQDESRRSVKEARSAQRPLKKRLARLEKAMSGAIEKRLAGLEKAVDAALAAATEAEAQAGARLEKLAARVEAFENLPERLDAVDKQVASTRKIADDVRAQQQPLARRLTELEALSREAANGSRKLEQRAADTIEDVTARTELAEVIGTLSARVAALDRRLSEAEKQSART